MTDCYLDGKPIEEFDFPFPVEDDDWLPRLMKWVRARRPDITRVIVLLPKRTDDPDPDIVEVWIGEYPAGRAEKLGCLEIEYKRRARLPERGGMHGRPRPDDGSRPEAPGRN